MVKLRTVVVVLVLMILSGWVGVWIGRENIRFKVSNWKPGIIYNRQANAALDNKPKDADFALFWTVWEKVNAQYVDKQALDPKKMVDGAIAGMVASLGDPYTMYLNIEQNKAANEELGGAFDGVGIQLGYDENSNLIVQTPIEDSPAMRAGVMAGDYIVRIADKQNSIDQTTEGMKIHEAVKLIRGKKGTEVVLTMRRMVDEKIGEPFEVPLIRDQIVVKSVVMEKLEKNGKKIAWIKLSRFGDRTQDEWREAVQAILADSEVKGVVVDVRNNPGGYLDGAVFVAGEFLPAGNVVVAQQYGDGRRIEHKVSRNGALLKKPVVILLNKGSASASEIFSGAMQDYDRAKLVGVLSFGKGSVQQPENFPDGSGIHVTIARWLRPSGEWIDKKGVTPDVEVKWENLKDFDGKWENDPQLNRALELL